MKKGWTMGLNALIAAIIIFSLFVLVIILYMMYSGRMENMFNYLKELMRFKGK